MNYNYRAMKNIPDKDPRSSEEYVLRHLIPANLEHAREAMLSQLRSLQEAIHGSTRDRVSQSGFFLGALNLQNSRVVDNNLTS